MVEPEVTRSRGSPLLPLPGMSGVSKGVEAGGATVAVGAGDGAVIGVSVGIAVAVSVDSSFGANVVAAKVVAMESGTMSKGGVGD